MAMTSAGMKAAMLDTLNLAAISGLDSTTRVGIEARIELLAQAIVEYIQNNADVAIGITVTGACPTGGGPLVSGVTTTKGTIL